MGTTRSATATELARAVAEGRPWVIDTNCVLDLCLFNDPRTLALRQALEAGRVRWLACAGMAEELERVLHYPAVQRAWLRLGSVSAQDTPGSPADVLQWFHRHSQLCEAPPPSGLRCQDRDDQVFIDLAVAHCAVLLSKDRRVLQLHRRMAAPRPGGNPGAMAGTPDCLQGVTF